MSNCNGCKSGCPSESTCGTTRLTHSTRPLVNPNHELSQFLKAPKAPKGDATPLTHPCNCPESPKLPRHACLPCIKSWVGVVEDSEIEEQIIIFVEEGNSVAADRITEVYKDKKRKRRYTNDEK